MALTERQKDLEGPLTMWVINENRRRGSSVSLDELELKANELGAILTPELDDYEIEQVRLSVTHKGSISQGVDIGIVDRTFRRWLGERKTSTDERRWSAYKGLLTARGWAPQVVEALERQTDDVVELLGDPTIPAPWARRGLLMGEVQSGKTATYIGVLNKAVDYGYRVIIILGGHTNDLRNQTQARVDQDLTGTNSSFLEDNIRGAGEQMRTGIGLVDRTLSTIGMTTVRRDFSASSRLASTVWVDTGVPTVFVIKKNVKMLENVASYIRAQAGPQGFDLPLVVVDDEADWGSPNTADPDTDPTRVNKAIRSLLDVSSRSTYLGITATPFANVLIDHTVEDDLFPSDYIRALASPSNYLGVGTYFDADSDVVTAEVDDCLQALPLKHKKDHPFRALPASLEDSVIAFMVGAAIRRLREREPQPASMMVNVSRFNQVQALVHREVEEFVSQVSAVIATEFKRPTERPRSELARRVEQVAYRHYSTQLTTEHSWRKVADSLFDIQREFRTELVNNQTAKDRANARRLMSQEQREAHDARPVIFVGGDVLSRGLTLNGLQVSYFIRRPSSADTLLQMGRWFGYRPGYDDLVRIWMPAKVEEIFGNVARISQELREDLREMQVYDLTPRQFGLKIRLIPEIAIVAANKRRAAAVEEVTVNLHGQVKQSVNMAEAHIKRNHDAVVEFLRSASLLGHPYTTRGQTAAWRNVPLTAVEGFFSVFTAHETDIFFGTDARGGNPQIMRFLSDAKNSSEWNVVVVSGSGPEVALKLDREGSDEPLTFKSSVRNKLQPNNPVSGSYHFKNQQVASPTDLASSLTEEVYLRLREEVEEGKPLDEVFAKRYVTHPTLMLYAVTTSQSSEGDQPMVTIRSNEPLWAVRVVFPPLDLTDPKDVERQGRGEKILVNSVWQEQFFGIDPEPEDFDEEVDG
jgi:Z1 domain